MSEVRRNLIGSFIDRLFYRPFQRLTVSVETKLARKFFYDFIGFCIIIILSLSLVLILYERNILCVFRGRLKNGIFDKPDQLVLIYAFRAELVFLVYFLSFRL